MTPPHAAVAALAALALIAAAPEAPDLDPAVRIALMRDLRFSTADLEDMAHGHVVKHALDAQTPGEFGVAGGVRIAASKVAFFDAARDIVHFKKDPGVLQIGRFSNPPTLDDLVPLTVDRDDFDPSMCRLHDCGVRLPADMIQRAQREIDPRAPDVQASAAAWFKRALLDDLVAYTTRTHARFAEYDDGDAPIRPLDDFAGVLAHTPAIGALVPRLPDHLADYPSAAVPGAEDFFYWSKEKFGTAPFISITQVTIVCPAAATCVMTTKDVYSSRYIDASLALAVASDAPVRGGFYLVYANRSRANALKGGLAGLKRKVVERRARSAIEDTLKRIRNRLEKGR